MARNGTNRLAPTRKRRIIERPRLLKLLDTSTAPTVLLVAPAGYGKTTIASQWTRDRTAGWLKAGPEASDVAALARGVACALAGVVPALPQHVEELLHVMSNPSRQPVDVARGFCSCIAEPLENWLVIDDYHVLAESAAAERLIELLNESGLFRFMIASRTLPSWATARRAIYGEIAVVGRDELALDDDEAKELLGVDDLASPVLSRARGWPAVIALAAFAGVSGSVPDEEIPTTLYQFFAEEIFHRASISTQDHLLRAALLPELTKDLIGASCEDSADDVMTQLLESGLVETTGSGIDMHPLARTFLRAKLRERSDARARVADAIAVALERETWDHALELIMQFEVHEYLDELITRSYRPLVATGRIATLERFRDAVSTTGQSLRLTELIDAEIAFRDAELPEAYALAQSAADHVPHDSPLKWRCLTLAGGAAQLLHQYDAAIALHEQACELASSARDAHEALWGLYLALLYSERSDFLALTDKLIETAETPDEKIRGAMAKLHAIRFREGFRSADQLRWADRLLGSVRDPKVRTSFGNVWSYTLLLQAKYAAAIEVAERAIEDGERFELAFALPHIHWTLAAAQLGHRNFSASDRHLRIAEKGAATLSDVHLEMNARILRARFFLAQQRPADAARATEVDWDERSTNAMYAEYMTTRALTLAVAGQGDDASTTLAEVAGLTDALEARATAVITRAVMAVGTGETEAIDDAFDLCRTHNIWDQMICAWRAVPALVENMANVSSRRRHIARVLVLSRDSALAKRIGLRHDGTYGRVGTLTPREREVLDLLRQGLTNAEIGRLLFISTTTVKVHVLHILEKLGAKTRAEAAVRYADADSESETDDAARRGRPPS